jgi:hypothetical protein
MFLPYSAATASPLPLPPAPLQRLTLVPLLQTLPLT